MAKEPELLNGVPAFTVTQFAVTLKGALKQMFAGGVWLEGEIEGMKSQPHATGHYFSLIDGEGKDKAKLDVKLFANSGDLKRVTAKLATHGLALQNGMRVRFFCEIDFYVVRGELSLIIKDVDTQFTVGDIAAKREELIRKLLEKGVDKINKRLEVPLVPLRLGIISSSQAAGYIDALKQLEESGIGFHITLCDVNVQGEAAAAQVVAAIQTFSRRSDIDIVMIMRGGGSKGDLAAFDDETMALAISRCAHPVFTGIGHEIDTSIADLVAHTASKTPTACAQTVIAYVEEFYGELSDAAHSLRQLTEYALTRSRARISLAVERLRTRPRTSLDRQVQKLEMHAAAVRLLDPAITMARGWSITRNAKGDVVRSISEISPGEKVITTLADGSVTSTVEGVA